jgi:hypothetical protein
MDVTRGVLGETFSDDWVELNDTKLVTLAILVRVEECGLFLRATNK